MVKFNFLQLPNPRLRPEMTKSFLQVGQLIGWELELDNSTFTGLLIVGEKGTPEGFQSMADCTLDMPSDGSPVPLETAKVIVQTVLQEFQQRGIVQLNPPGSTAPPGKIKGNIKVDPPSCGHTGPIQVTGNRDGEWSGKCAQCGAPAKVQMEITDPPQTAR